MNFGQGADLSTTLKEPQDLSSASGNGMQNQNTIPPVNTDPVPKTELNIDPHEKPEPKPTTVNFKTQDFLKGYAGQNTGPIGNTDPNNTNTNQPKQETLEELRARLAQEDAKERDKMSLEDFKLVADFIIDTVDMGAIFVLRWWAKDNTDANYKIPKEKIDKMKERLTNLLVRMQTKFPLGFLFILSVIMAYATPYLKAKEHRAAVLKEQERLKKEAATQDIKHEDVTNKTNTSSQQTQTNTKPAETRGGTKNFKRTTGVPLLKRPKGGVSK